MASRHDRETIVLENGLLAAKISARTGVLVEVQSKLTGERLRIEGDRAGVTLRPDGGSEIAWEAGAGHESEFAVEIATKDDRVELALATTVDGVAVTLEYQLSSDRFWLERRLVANTTHATYDRLIYGAVAVKDATVKELKLGKFDTPRLLSVGKGGVFAGVGWWFYEVKDGVYQNTGMKYATEGRFVSEPWYVGVFQPELGEPYAGWLWYKAFLETRKLAYDKLPSYVLWNARSGYSFNPINNPDLLGFVATARQIGLSGITTGEVRGLAHGTTLAATDPIARKVIDTYAAEHVEFGLHEGDVRADHWRTDEGLARKLAQIDAAARQGIRNLTIDFFGVDDRFADHRRVATFFRHVRERMSYTECHLGMAVYGPQFQREVLINHPTDLHGFDIARFSADWATLLGFRQSRREWQKRYEYLMPENGLFYFSTHYSNYPRHREDPERQQFLYIADAWRGLAYAFHDKVGFRDAVATQAAFSTFYVFGFLDDQMPPADARFAHDYLAWVRTNASLLNRGRVCAETEAALVMSKVRDGRGAIFAVNYLPGARHFVLDLALGTEKPIEVRQIYPTRGPVRRLRAGEALETTVPGERLAIFDVNGGLNGLPPENSRAYPIDVVASESAKSPGFSGEFTLPESRASLTAGKDPTLPARIVSADQVETEIVTTKPAGRSKGKLPAEFLAAYGFAEEKYLETWKVVPWAYADRVWLVYAPTVPPVLSQRRPSLTINGQVLPMVPRVAYDPRARGLPPAQWQAPIWFADITEHCRYGARNEVAIAHDVGDDKGTRVFVTSASLR